MNFSFGWVLPTHQLKIFRVNLPSLGDAINGITTHLIIKLENFAPPHTFLVRMSHMWHSLVHPLLKSIYQRTILHSHFPMLPGPHPFAFTQNHILLTGFPASCLFPLQSLFPSTAQVKSSHFHFLAKQNFNEKIRVGIRANSECFIYVRNCAKELLFINVILIITPSYILLLVQFYRWEHKKRKEVHPSHRTQIHSKACLSKIYALTTC